MSKAGRRDRSSQSGGEAGFTYLVVLVLLVSLTLAAQATWIPAATKAQRHLEEEFIFRGEAYRRAIRSYYELESVFPPNLEVLLNDPRQSGKRHIRRLYEPVFGDTWGLIRATDGGIQGIVSTSEQRSLRKPPPGVEVAKVEQKYSDWKFIVIIVD